MYQLIRRKNMKLNIGQYLLWIGVEILSMSMFYAMFEWLILSDPRPFWLMYRIALVNTSLVLLLPYAVLWLYFAHDHNQRLLRKLDEKENAVTPQHITFYDGKGVMRLSMKLEDLYYLKGADNYIELIYQHHDKQAKYHLRTTMKRLQEELNEYPLIRCHRSYMVNLEKIKLIRRESGGMVLELDSSPLISIPVSKTYMDDVFQQFGNTANQV